MCDGFARIYVGSFQSRVKLVLSGMGLALGAWSQAALLVLPLAYVALRRAGMARGEVFDATLLAVLAGLSLLALVLPLWVYCKVNRLAELPKRWVLWTPLATLVVGSVIARAWWWL